MRVWVQNIFVLISLAVIVSAAPAADVWYQDNNLRNAGGMPSDFVEKFHQPESFQQATRYINVYMVRARVLHAMDDQFFTKLFIPYLNKNNIKLAIDAVGATWTQRGARKEIFNREIDLLRRLKQLGVEVHYISLQSVLSKTPRDDGKKVDYPLSQRIEDVVAYSKAARAVYPQVAIGIIDALPSHGKDYRQPYRLLKEAMAREKTALSYIHLDISFNAVLHGNKGVTWQTIRQLESYVEDDLGLKFGYYTKSRKGGHTSSKAFHEGVMAALECYRGAGGTPGDLIIASWFPYPKKTIPEMATGDDYPAMRTVLEFGRQLERIEQAGPSWAAQRAREPGWRAMCTAG